MDRANAEYAVEQIIEDLRDRTYLGEAWDMIRAAIQDEIVESWVNILTEA